jgi:hypothetical protein
MPTFRVKPYGHASRNSLFLGIWRCFRLSRVAAKSGNKITSPLFGSKMVILMDERGVHETERIMLSDIRAERRSNRRAAKTAVTA